MTFDNGTGGGGLLEREHELRTLTEALESTKAGRGTALALVGPPGIGKSALCAAAASIGNGLGLRVHSARGGALEKELAWGVVRELLTGAAGRNRAVRFDGVEAFARPVLSGESSGRQSSDPEAATIHGLYWLLAELAAEHPLLLVVDDAHWADAASLRWLTYLAARIQDLPACVLVATRPGGAETPGDLELILTRSRSLVPRALSPEACLGLLRSLLGRAVEPVFARACRHATGGNPFLLTELAGEVATTGIAPVAQNAAHIEALRPEAVARTVLHRLGPRGKPERDLAEAVAILAQRASTRDAVVVAGLSEEQTQMALASLVDAGIIDGGLPLRFVHPIVREVIAADIPAARQAQLHQRAADALRHRRATPERVALHLLHSEPRADERAVRDLRKAATGAMRSGAPDLAADYLRRALEEPPIPTLEPTVMLELAEAEAALGSSSALELLKRAAEGAAGGAQRATIWRRLGEVLFQAGQPARAQQAFEAALHEVEDQPRAQGANELQMLIDAMGLITGARSAACPPREMAGTASRELLAHRSLALVSAGADGGQARKLALRAAGDGAMVREHGPGVTFSIVGSCLIWCDALEDALREIDHATGLAAQTGDLPGLALMRFGRSWAGYWMGRLEEALADVEVATRAWSGEGRLQGQLAHAAYWRSLILIELDELGAAEQALAIPGELLPFHRAAIAAGQARAALAGGDAKRALARIDEVRTVATESPFFRSAAIIPWRDDAALAAKLAGDKHTARRYADESLTLARRFGIERQLGTALRTAGLVHDDVTLLVRAVDVLERSPSQLELTRTLVALGALERRLGHRAQARQTLRRALDLASRSAARALARRAREELRAAGARPRRERLSGPEALTPGERRVSELAATGLTNREIAQQLFLSLRTVETHLTHAYRKLDIQSRAGLAGVLAAHPETEAGGVT